MPAQEVLDMATLSGAKFLGFDDCGAIKLEMKADINCYKYGQDAP